MKEMDIGKWIRTSDSIAPLSMNDVRFLRSFDHQAFQDVADRIQASLQPTQEIQLQQVPKPTSEMTTTERIDHLRAFLEAPGQPRYLPASEALWLIEHVGL